MPSPRRRPARPGQHDAHGEIVRDLALQEHHAAVERHAADAGFGQAELRIGRGDDDVAAEHHFEAAAEGEAVDTRDQRDVEALAEGDAAETVRTRSRPSIPGRTGRRCPFMSAPAEKARSPAPVSTAQETSLRPSSSVQIASSSPLRCRIHGIEPVGPVDRDPCDAIRRLVSSTLMPALWPRAVPPRRRGSPRCARPASAAHAARGRGRPTCRSG